MKKHPNQIKGYASKLAAMVTCFVCSVVTPVINAKLVETIIKVPVKASNAYGKVSEQEAVVTLFYDDAAPKPYPVAIINHGRSVKPDQRATFGRSTSITNARWFASMGFLVVVPTRLGYGVTGGEDVEDSGECKSKIYHPTFEAAASQTLQILAAIRQRPDVLIDHTLILGQSFGGTTAVTLAAKNPAGVQATINFAGGGGGNPEIHPQQPCGSSQLKRMFAHYGETARTPTLWVYTENDQWMGPTYPREWFEAFKEKGGVGEFVQFPPNGKDGHGLFTQAPDIWRPRALEFLRANGYPELKVKEETK